MSEGAVWLHRKVLESTLWSCSDACLRGFITCLLLANFKDQEWYSRAEHKQIILARGSFFTTRIKFASVSNLSEQQVRDCFKILEDLHIITSRRTARGTFITILNYNDYQKIGTRRSTNEATSREPDRNQPRTWLEEGKEREEGKEGGKTPVLSLSEYVNFWKEKPQNERQANAAKIAEHLKTYKLSYRVEEDIYTQITGGEENGAVRSKSISEQVAQRRREERAKGLRKETSARSILAGIRDLPDVQSET